MKPRSAFSTVFLIVIVLIAWSALFTQFRVHMQGTQASQGELAIRYFSYFTTLSNLLIAVAGTCILIFPRQAAGRFFARQTTLTAIAVYIFVVTLIYNTVLRFTWHPTGLARILDESVHVIVPVLFVLYWLTCVPKQRLPVRAILPWLLFPMAYIVYALVRGSGSGFYPYPFVDVTKLGIKQVLINSVFVALAIIVIALVFVGVGNLQAGKTKYRNL